MRYCLVKFHEKKTAIHFGMENILVKLKHTEKRKYVKLNIKTIDMVENRTLRYMNHVFVELNPIIYENYSNMDVILYGPYLNNIKGSNFKRKDNNQYNRIVNVYYYGFF